VCHLTVEWPIGCCARKAQPTGEWLWPKEGGFLLRDYYAAPVTRTWDEDVYYGSSYPEPGYGASYYAEPRYYGPLGY
jgi:hypothetical protein